MSAEEALKTCIASLQQPEYGWIINELNEILTLDDTQKTGRVQLLRDKLQALSHEKPVHHALLTLTELWPLNKKDDHGNYTCPLTLEAIKLRLVTSTGHHYELSAINDYIKKDIKNPLTRKLFNEHDLQHIRNEARKNGLDIAIPPNTLKVLWSFCQWLFFNKPQ